jgi:tRNA (cytidine32/uridine32-2'-O)-methyltransferase
MLDNIRVVLIKTFHPGNIGSSARAMKTMGLKQLYLVNPLTYPDSEANKMAASAEDVLDSAVVVESLYDAVKDCSFVAACTGRVRGYDLPSLSPEQCAKQLLSVADNGPVALVFGPERFGLSNDDLSLAQYRVTIAANPSYSSLNLAAAVQTLSYEIYKQYSDDVEDPAEAFLPRPTTEELELFYSHLESTFSKTNFINKRHPGQVMQKLRGLFARTELDTTELNILRGLLASVDRFTK